MIRYLTALITATLAGLAGVWLVLAPAALDYPGPGVYASGPARVSVVTGAVLCVVAVLTAVCWSAAWRSRLRAEGVLPGHAAPRREAERAGEPSRRPAEVRRDAVRPKAPEPALPRSPRSEAVPPEKATTGPLPPVPVAVPVRLEDRGLHALLAPRVAALTRDGEASSERTSAGAARGAAVPFADAAPAGRSRRRAGWRAWPVADDDAEETW